MLGTIKKGVFLQKLKCINQCKIIAINSVASDVHEIEIVLNYRKSQKIFGL